MKPRATELEESARASSTPNQPHYAVLVDELRPIETPPVLMLPIVCVIPAFVMPPTCSLRAASAPSAITCSFTNSELTRMYGSRWALSANGDIVHSGEEEELRSVQTTVAQVGAAALAVTAMSGIGAFKSVATTPFVLMALQNTWGYGNVDDISKFLDMITGWVAHSNALVATQLPTGSFVFILAMLVDTAALASMIMLLTMAMQENWLAASVDELCLPNKPVCGKPSFDSTDEYACVETLVDGKLTWVCA